MKIKRLFLLLSLAAGGCVAGIAADAQDRLPGYLQAERFTAEKTGKMLFSTKVDPHWFQQGNSFWYEYSTTEGKFWYVVDPSERSQRLLFDRDWMAARLTETVGDPYDAAHLPIRNLKAAPDGHTFTFDVTSTRSVTVPEKDGKPKKTEKEMFFFSYDSRTQELTHLKDKEKEPSRLSWGSISPDGKTVLYAKDLNLYRMSFEDYQKLRKDSKDSTVVEVQLTTDGTDGFGFGIPYSILNTEKLCNGKRRSVWGRWSPDSRYFATIVSDDRALKPYWVINAMAAPRPTLETYRYQMPGEKESSVDHLYLFDLSDNSRKEIGVSAYKDQSLGIFQKQKQQKERDMEYRHSVWQGDAGRFFLSRSSRDLHRIDICSYTIGEDSIRTVIKERMNTYQEIRPLMLLDNGRKMIQWSERDGWAHLYLYDDKGQLLNRITEGPWHVEEILKVDEKAGTVYFMANGRNKGEHPYYEHLYRVNLDGSGLRQLTHGDYFHFAEIDDQAQYVVDNYSCVSSIPCTVLLDNKGKVLMELQKSDFSQLLAAGYKFPETFKVKAADGITDLYGVMYKPFDFDSTKVYPIIDYVYPGPQVEGTDYPFTRMSVRTDRLAQAGFIVITVGQRGGHPSRSKWYHNYGYGNMRDYPLEDHKYAIEQLADRHDFIDISKVGIHGHSGGGFMTAAAMFQYPDFFKVGVSCAGNHDNNIYNRWWSETHHGVKEVVSDKGDTTFVFNVATNQQIASQLKGHLLLVHGDIDNNVHPSNTLRVVEALIRAGKRFDMLILPQQRHSFGNMDEYFYWRLVDYFSEHLKGERETSVDIPER